MTFGEKIVFLRKSKGMSQDQLAALLGVTRQSVSKWERGEVVADTDRVLALSRLFGVSCDYLLNDGITDAASSKAAPPVAAPQRTNATVPPLKKTGGRAHWHWLGLLPLLWGLFDLLGLQLFCRSFTGIRSIPYLFFLIGELISAPHLIVTTEGFIVILFLTMIIVALVKIGIGFFLILRGCKKNATLAKKVASTDTEQRKELRL